MQDQNIELAEVTPELARQWLGFNDDISYGWRREQLPGDGRGGEIAAVVVVVPGIWCDMGAGCVNGPGGHWWDGTCRTPDP